MVEHVPADEAPGVDIDRLMDEIREEVAQRRKTPFAPLPFEEPEVPAIHQEKGSIVDFSKIRSILSSAEAHADVGAQVTPMLNFRGITRQFALFAGKIVIYLSSFITVKQRGFNETILHALRTMTDAIESLEQQILSHHNRQIETNRSFTNSLKTVIDGLKKKEAERVGLEKTVFQLKTGLIMQENRLTTLLEEARKRLPGPFDEEQLRVMADEKKHFLEALYLSFEDQFRGTREDIKGRLKVYLPLFKKAGIGTDGMPILDVGCGRGEWLEVLQEEKLQARGVDHNRLFVTQCQERGCEVTEGDMVGYLRALPNASLGAVTGFHIIEHLPFEVLLDLLDETVRVLKAGGVAIFETPNPQNVSVGSCNFYVDPTHRRPLPSSVMKFIVEARGLCRVEVINLHPYPEAFWISGSELANRFSEYFYGPQDYAVVGVKP